MPFKLLTLADWGLMSYSARGMAACVYPIGAWVEAPDWLAKLGYGLCVFDTMEHARRFDRFPSDGIWECEVEDAHEPTVRPIRHDALEDGYTDESGEDWPLGTLHAKRVKIIRRVEIP